MIDKGEIEKRLDAIEELNKDSVSRDEIREYLNAVYDLERLLGKVSYKTANPRDLIAFRNSLEMMPHIKAVLSGFQKEALKEIEQDIDSLEDIYGLICNAIEEDPPVTIREGGMIKSGFDENIDMLRKAKTDGKTWLAQLENEDKERTGIKNLKIKYNKVFGYYFEVTNSLQGSWCRRTYISKADPGQCGAIHNAKSLRQLEDSHFKCGGQAGIPWNMTFSARSADSHCLRVVTGSRRRPRPVARLDVLCLPVPMWRRAEPLYKAQAMNEKGVIDIKDGRHPVVEQMTDYDSFIANDTYLDNGKAHCISVITGPNMAGKSTYMRQVSADRPVSPDGLLCSGTGAPTWGSCDRIFTRVGASDDLASGQSPPLW